MMMQISAGDPRLTWEGVISVERTSEWAMPWRLPHEARLLFPPDALIERAAMPAGVRLVFRSDTASVAGKIEPQPETASLDLCVDDTLFASAPLAGREEFRFEGLPPGEKLVELWLPQFGRFRLRSLELSDGASIDSLADRATGQRPRWITYGSSITQCRAAESPTQTWPAIVARGRGLDLTCLGYGGQCHLDPMVARVIRDRPADFLSMCVGINVLGSGSLNARTFRPAIIGFVQIVREKHPETPLAVMSPIYSPPRETTLNAVGLNLMLMRDEVSAAVSALQAHGDRNIHYIDGLRVFGPDLAHLLPDQLHPNAEGYKVLGENFLREVASTVFV